MNNVNKKSILIAIVVLMVGLLITGGTYAYLTVAMTVTNGNYVTNTHCFEVTYQNDDTSITGTLFPSGDAYGGISDWVSATADASCNLTGKGTLKIHVNSASTILTGTVPAHCENEKTLETQSDYTTQSACTAVTGNKWVTDGTALKYAVFSDDDLYSSGYIKSTDIGNDIIAHDNFSVTTTSKKFDVYIWLDGYLSNENYYDLDFSASSNMIVRQVKSTETYPGDTPLVDDYLIQLRLNSFDTLYQRVEYIQSTGTQYIDTGFVANQDTRFVMKVKYVSGNFIFGSDGDNNGYLNAVGLNSASGKFRWHYDSQKFKDYGSFSYGNIYEIDINKNIMYLDGNSTVSFNYVDFQTPSSVLISGIRRGSNAINMSSYGSSLEIYYFRIYDNDILVRDFVPSKRITDSKPGLFDSVSGVFYTNAATSGDDFTVGPDV